ncbi:Alpha/Beta hydrolase protein, partial [Ilyonectria robusta]|uniref:Alpha/Beta hydrolase protein n=1 Tax=Ilyonectria robusta TaxID=1079257 RepID=UPI001E8E44C0
WVTELLEHGVEVLIYAGDTDWLCTSRGMRYFVDNLAWTGSAVFISLSYHEVLEPCWRGRSVSYRARRCVVGYQKAYENSSFIEITQAGHMTLGDQPEVALDMLHAWVADHRGP